MDQELLLGIAREAGIEVYELHGYKTIIINDKDACADFEDIVRAVVKLCGYHADVFHGLGCPVDMDPTETKPSDYIKRNMGIE